MSGRVWTTGELGELRRLTAQKIANQEIAERLGRTKQAIANQKSKHNINSKVRTALRSGYRWHDWEDDLLRDLAQISNAKAAEKLSSTVEAIKARRKYLRNVKK